MKGNEIQDACVWGTNNDNVEVNAILSRNSTAYTTQGCRVGWLMTIGTNFAVCLRWQDPVQSISIQLDTEHDLSTSYNIYYTPFCPWRRSDRKQLQSSSYYVSQPPDLHEILGEDLSLMLTSLQILCVLINVFFSFYCF